MIIMIVGKDAVDVCEVKRKDRNRNFFQLRGQLYKVFPEGFRRIRMYDDKGIETATDDVMIFRENSIIPYNPGDVNYSLDRILAEIDEHKLMTGGIGGLLGAKPYFTAAAKAWDSILPFVPWIIVGLVLAYAFLG